MTLPRKRARARAGLTVQELFLLQRMFFHKAFRMAPGMLLWTPGF